MLMQMQITTYMYMYIEVRCTPVIILGRLRLVSVILCFATVTLLCSIHIYSYHDCVSAR